jgi:hypothetical protein
LFYSNGIGHSSKCPNLLTNLWGRHWHTYYRHKYKFFAKSYWKWNNLRENGCWRGSINLEPALVSPAFGNGSIVRGVAPTSASVNKITPIVSYTASTQFYTKFDILLGNSTGGNTGAVDGTWFFFQGEGASYSDANAFSGAQVFTGLQFIFSAGGNFTANYRNGAAWTLLTPGVQGVKYTVEIIGNNSFASINYTYGSPQSVAPNTYDIWVNGVLAGNDLNKGLLASGANISSMMFYGISSIGNAANLFTDNISVSNTIPALICPASIPVTANVTPGNSVCAGTSITLTGSGANTYTWTDGLNTPNNGIAFIPTTTATYTVTGTDGNGCTGTSSITVTVNLNPNTTASASPATICQGSSSNLSSTGATSYVWNPGGLTGANVSVSPNATTIYTVTGTTGVCTVTSTVTVTVNSTPAPTLVTATPNSFCAPGGTAHLNATSAGNTINWFTVPSGGISIGSSASGVNFSVSPANTTTYYAESVAPAGGSQTFNFTGGMQSFTVPAGVTAVTITAKGAQGGYGGGIIPGVGGFGSSASGILTVTPGDVLNIFVGGQGTTTGGFNGGGNGGNLNAGGGGGASDVRLNSVAVAARVIVGAGGGGGGTGGCITQGLPNGGNGGDGNANGTNGMTSTSGGGGFAAAGAVGGAAGIGCILGSPGQTAINEIGGNGGNGQGCCCVGTPGGGGGGGGQVGGGGGGGGTAGTVICNGNDKGGGGGGAGGSSFTGTLASPVFATGVQVANGEVVIAWTGTGCPSATRTLVTITVNPAPAVTANASPLSICIGGSSTLTGGGANTYSWNPGALAGSPTVSPLATTTYSVLATDGNGCTGTSEVTVSVNPLPTVTASPASQTICENAQATVNGGGAVSYVWTGGISNGVPFTVTGANVYTVTGTDGNGCENTATAEVLMNAAPVINATATPSTTCNLTSVNPCATGAVSYVWTGGLSNCTPFVATTTDTYTVTGTDGAGCTGTSSVTVTVTPASGTISTSNNKQSVTRSW